MAKKRKGARTHPGIGRPKPLAGHTDWEVLTRKPFRWICYPLGK